MLASASFLAKQSPPPSCPASPDRPRPLRHLTPPSLSSGRCISAGPFSRPFSLTPPPPASRLLPYSSSHSSHASTHAPTASAPVSSQYSSHLPRWAGRHQSSPLVSSSAADVPFSALSSLACSHSESLSASSAVTKPRSSSAAASWPSAVSSRSYALWAGLLVFSLLLSLLFIVHLSAHAAPLSDAGSPLSLPLAAPGSSGLIRVAPNSVHGPASALQPQLLFSRSVASRQLETFAERKKRKEAIAVEEQVEADMRRMRKISEQLKAAWQAKQRTQPAATIAAAAATPPSQPAAPAAAAAGAEAKVAAQKAVPAVALRGEAAAVKITRDSKPAAPH
ncbi:hypothetical protein MMC34_008579 [Xylographa carneopallida]|nr:hypothetical protein [Xylographa carneopallida]